MIQKIASKFSNAAHSYDSVAHIQLESSVLLTKMLQKNIINEPSTILDLGSGTGNMSDQLLKHYPSAHFTLVDIADEMINFTRQKYANLNNFSFKNADIQELQPTEYDLITSNFCLQWVDDLAGTISKFSSKTPIFAFTCLLDGTFNELSEALSPLNTHAKKYPTYEQVLQYANLCKHSKIDAFSHQHTLHFADFKEFLQYTKRLGANASSSVVPLHFLRKLLLKNQPFSVTYNIMYCVITR